MPQALIVFLILLVSLYSCSTDERPVYEDIEPVGVAEVTVVYDTVWCWATEPLRVIDYTHKKVGDLMPGDRVVVLEEFQNHTPEDELTLNGLFGHMVPIEWEGGRAFVFSGYLSSCKMPKDLAEWLWDETPVDTLLWNVDESIHEADERVNTTVVLPEGIIRKENGTYEFRAYELIFPEASFQEAYLYANSLIEEDAEYYHHWHQFFSMSFPEIPLDTSYVGRDYWPDGKEQIEVQFNNTTKEALGAMHILVRGGCYHAIRIWEDAEGTHILIEDGC